MVILVVKPLMSSSGGTVRNKLESDIKRLGIMQLKVPEEIYKKLLLRASSILIMKLLYLL